MTPVPLRLTHLRRLALRLAERGELSVQALARAGRLSERQALWWVRLLESEGAIRAIGTDPDQRMGRPRTVYGRRRGR